MLVNALTLLFAIFASIAAVPVDDFSKGISNFATDFYQVVFQFSKEQRLQITKKIIGKF